MAGVDDIIGRWVKEVEKTGELQRSERFGKPFALDDAYQRTPEELRLVHKVLKNAGYAPAEQQQKLAVRLERRRR